MNLVGGSLDYYSQGIDTVFRVETSYTSGEEFANTLRKELYSESDVLRYVVGADKSIFIPALNENQAFLFSGQILVSTFWIMNVSREPTARQASRITSTTGPQRC